MPLSPFMTQFKKDIKKLSKKQLVKRLLISVDMNAHQSLQDSIQYDDLKIEFDLCTSQLEITKLELIRTEGFLKSAESALRMYENFSIFQFIHHKFKR